MIDQWGVGHEPSPNSMHMTYMRHPLENAETLEELEAYPYPDFAGGSRDHQKEQVRRVKEQDLFSRNDRHADRDAARHAGRSEERSVEKPGYRRRKRRASGCADAYAGTGGASGKCACICRSLPGVRRKKEMKTYKAIFFDWDGTAVRSRKEPADKVAACMKPLLEKGVKLIIISGTTYDKIADGRLHGYFTEKELDNLYLGLARGAHNYSFEDGQPVLHGEFLPKTEEKLRVHDCVFRLHQHLLREYGLESDIVFTRPNYCKLDLMVEHDRSDSLFLQEGETEMVQKILRGHGIAGGLAGLMAMAEQIGRETGIAVKATTDAKYLEIGLTTKSDNVDYFADQVLVPENIKMSECCFWGDEFIYLDEGIPGSDAYMITEKTKGAEFYDVSDIEGKRPKEVDHTGGETEKFHLFLKKQFSER